MVARIKLTLRQTEYSALLKMAVAELRNPADQARYLLRCELTRRGLLEGPQDLDKEILPEEASWISGVPNQEGQAGETSGENI